MSNDLNDFDEANFSSDEASGERGALHFDDQQLNEMSVKMASYLEKSGKIGETSSKWTYPFSRHYKFAIREVFSAENLDAFQLIDNNERRSFWLQFQMRSKTLFLFIISVCLFSSTLLLSLGFDREQGVGNDLVSFLLLLVFGVYDLVLIPFNAISNYMKWPMLSEISNFFFCIVLTLPIFAFLMLLRRWIRRDAFSTLKHETSQFGGVISGVFTRLYDDSNNLLDDSLDETGKDWIGRSSRNVSLALYLNELSDDLDRYLSIAGWRSIDGAIRIKHLFGTFNIILAIMATITALLAVHMQGMISLLNLAKAAIVVAVYGVYVWLWSYKLLTTNTIWRDLVVTAIGNAYSGRKHIFTRVERNILLNKRALQKARFNQNAE